MIRPSTPHAQPDGLSRVGDVIRTMDLSPAAAAGDVIARLGHTDPRVRQVAHNMLMMMYPGYVDDLETGQLG